MKPTTRLSGFQKGNKLAAGGPRENSGRPPNAFKEKCAALGNSPAFLKWAEDVLEGRYEDTKVCDGVKIKVPVSVGDRTYLWEKVCDRGYGKAAQAVEVGGKDGGPISVTVVRYE